MSRALLVLALTGCKDSSPPVTPTDTAPYTSSETGLADDTSEPDPDDTGEPPDDGIVELRLFPDGLVVHPGATFSVRVVGQDAEEAWTDLDLTVSSDDETVVTVVDGVATAIAAGEVALRVSHEELEAEAQISVRDDGAIDVIVVSAVDGSPLQGAKVKLSDDDEAEYTSPEGKVRLPVSDGGPLAVTAYTDAYVPATIYGTVAREVVVPLRPDEVASEATVVGSVSLDGVESGGAGDLIVGIAIPALVHGPALIDPNALTGPARELEVFGVEATVPGNLYLRDIAEDYVATQEPGPARMWTLAGALPISELTAGLEGSGDALGLVGDHVEDMSWGWGEAAWVDAGESADVDLSPAEALDEVVTVEVPELSLGFSGDESPLVLVGELLSDGAVVPTGLGLGLDTVTVHETGGGFGVARVATAMAQVGGLGEGGATCVSSAPLTDERAELPPWLDVPEVDSFSPTSKAFALVSDDESSLVRVTIEAGDGGLRDLYVSGGAVEGVLPDPGFSFGYGQTRWTLVGLAPTHGTFEHRVASGELSLEVAARDAWSSCRVFRAF